MDLNQHVTPAEFKLLLYGEPQEQHIRQIELHVDSCIECQTKLDDMAADPMLWAQAPKLVSSRIGSNSTLSLDRFDFDSERLSTEHFESLEHLLDTPTHPEMMGRIGDYDVEREVGRGGMGIVFKAFDSELNRPLAIKVLAPWLARNGTARKRFEREARAAAAVLHPNVVAIYGVNATHRVPYLVMPYVAGPSLQQLIDKNGPLCEKDVVRMALQITAGLVAAHAQGLVHRDIKPANILVEADVSRVLVTDFGLARAVDDASATQSGYFVGTPNYMSPEQAMGHRVDARSDLFSLGSLIYFMSTGRMPFRAESPLCVLNRISNDEPTNVRQVNSEVSQTIANVISRLLEKAPADRFQSASELHEVLEQYLSYLHQPDVSQPPRIKHRRWSNRSSVHIMLGVLSSVLLLITLAAGLGTGWIRMPSYFKRMENSGPTDWSDGKVTSAKPTTSNDAGEWEPKSSVLDLGSGGAAQSEWAIPSSVANPGEQGVPGELVTIRSHFSGAGVDGYTMYLPSSYNKTDIKYPLLICLQGGNSVGGDFRVIEKGLYLLLHKSHDPRTDLPTMLQDSMIILSPHLKSGEYYHQVDAMKELVEEITTEYRADRRRVYLPGSAEVVLEFGVWLHECRTYLPPSHP